MENKNNMKPISTGERIEIELRKGEKRSVHRRLRSMYGSSRFDMVSHAWTDSLREHYTPKEKLILMSLRLGGWKNTSMFGFYERDFEDFCIDDVEMEQEEVIAALESIKEKGENKRLFEPIKIHYEVVWKPTEIEDEPRSFLQVYMPGVLTENAEAISQDCIAKGMMAVIKRRRGSFVLALWASGLSSIVRSCYGENSAHYRESCQLLALIGAKQCSNETCCAEPCSEGCKHGRCYALDAFAGKVTSEKFYHNDLNLRSGKNFLKRMKGVIGGQPIICNTTGEIKIRNGIQGNSDPSEAHCDFALLPQSCDSSPSPRREKKGETDDVRACARRSRVPFAISFVSKSHENTGIKWRAIDDDIDAKNAHASNVDVEHASNVDVEHASNVDIVDQKRAGVETTLEDEEERQDGDTVPCGAAGAQRGVRGRHEAGQKKKAPRIASRGSQENMGVRQADEGVPKNTLAGLSEDLAEQDGSITPSTLGKGEKQKTESIRSPEEELQAAIDAMESSREKTDEQGVVIAERPRTPEEILRIREMLKASTKNPAQPHLIMCRYLTAKILEANPGGRVEYITSGKARKRWEDQMRLMIMRDRRSLHDLAEVIDWAKDHHFWASKILTPSSLRKSFDRLRMEMVKQKEHKN